MSLRRTTPSRRGKARRYDEVRRLGLMAAARRWRPGPGGFNVGFDDLSDLLGGFFGRWWHYARVPQCPAATPARR